MKNLILLLSFISVLSFMGCSKDETEKDLLTSNTGDLQIECTNASLIGLSYRLYPYLDSRTMEYTYKFDSRDTNILPLKQGTIAQTFEITGLNEGDYLLTYSQINNSTGVYLYKMIQVSSGKTNKVTIY